MNVYTPYLPLNASSKAAKPVIFWIHGGGNTGGTGADATFDGGSLASRADVVVVTINHRLNIFGELRVLFPIAPILFVDAMLTKSQASSPSQTASSPATTPSRTRSPHSSG